MSDAILLTARLALGAVFAVAAVAKLADRAGTREAVRGFGAPSIAVAPLALVIPAVELAAAALLVPAQTAVPGAFASLGLLAVFSGAIAWNLAHGRTPDCHCFGQLHAAPAGAKTLARNAALGALAAVVVLGAGGPSAIAWIGRLDGAGLAAFVLGLAAAGLAAGAALAFASVLQKYGRALRRIDRLEATLSAAGIEVDIPVDTPAAGAGLALGGHAPSFVVEDITGATVSLDDLLAPRLPLMLVFASPHCGPCSALLPTVAEWQREHSGRLRVAIASDGSAEAVRAEAGQLALDSVLLDEGGELYGAFEARGTPGAVLIAPDGRIASHVATGSDAIESLVRTVTDDAGLAIGTAAPAVELQSLDGESITLGAASDAATLVVFWNPDCGFCRAMRDDLLAAEAATEDARLLIVSSGDASRTRADGFTSTVLLDPDFRAGTAFGAGGTPAAVRLAADGTVASSVAVGASAVLALAGSETTARLAVVVG